MTQNPPRINISLSEAIEHAARLKHTLSMAKNKDGVVTLTPYGASTILEHLNFPGQRKLKEETRVFGHHLRIIKGDWLEGHAITFAELPDGRIWLMDGQHRLTAISKCGGNVSVAVRIVPVENEAEAAEFYAGFDMASSVRTETEVIQATGAAEKAGLSTAMAKSVAEASVILGNDMEPLSGSASVRKNAKLFYQGQRMSAIRDWAEEARIYEALIKPSKRPLRSRLLESGVVAVALFTIHHQPAKAKEFWSGLATNDGLRNNDPRAALYTDLISRNLSVGSVRQRVQQPAVAWNAFFKGRKLQQIKCVVDAPIVILGTPLKG